VGRDLQQVVRIGACWVRRGLHWRSLSQIQCHPNRRSRRIYASTNGVSPASQSCDQRFRPGMTKAWREQEEYGGEGTWRCAPGLSLQDAPRLLSREPQESAVSVA